MNDEIERMEIKISYLESQYDELNNAVIKRERTISILEKRIEALERKVVDLIEVSGPARPSRRPPHY